VTSGAETWGDCRVATERYLADSLSLAALLLDGGLRVERTNQAFRRMAGLRTSPTGRTLDDLLAPASRGAAESLLAGASQVERLEFVGDGGAAFLLTCRVYPEGERRILLGDALTLTDSEVLRAMSRLNDEVVNLGRDLERKNRELHHAMDEVRTLRGILPICMFCKRIRDDSGYWQQLEIYISGHSEAQFSHGLCARCADEHYP
jgi:hypothetical protein